MTPAEIASALSSVYDPELGIDIVSLGLIYGIDISDDALDVRFAVTSAECPLSDAIAGMAARRLEAWRGGRELRFEVVDEPPWEPAMLDRAAREQLGLPPR